ncbi:hypothetical protein TBK1r_20490 [Stieleria magnilauensis]|uniref:Uncharacterized protein n=1 Tax=Stieleria magnilauensis TaxID=2527963 RepID=A0ABX5XM94_9BACT|nr:hypothetical protein TBK1r_20490 [Planctomycetes bacterium TBK1r]
MRLWFNPGATGDQASYRTKTLTTLGRWIHDARASCTVACPTEPRPANPDPPTPHVKRRSGN